MNQIISVCALALAVLYWLRLTGLLYNRHGWLFVATQALNGSGCIYSSYELWERGLDAPACFIVAMAGSYLLRSRESYVEAITRPMDIGQYDLTQVHGGHK